MQNEIYIKNSYTDLSGETYNGVTFTEYQFTKNSCDFWKCKCHCGEYFTVRGSDIKSGHTKSCGCLRRETTRKTGLSNTASNIMQHSLVYDYIRVFYRDKNLYFLINNTPEAIEKISQGCFSRQVRQNNKADPIRIVGGKLVKASRELANTPEDLLTDHINHEPEDCRIINLRNGTQLQNQANSVKGVGRVAKLSNGKYGIAFPDELNIDTSNLVFDTKDEAHIIRKKIEAVVFGEWTYEKSQGIAKEFATCEFTFDPYIDAWANTGTLGEIMQLPPDNVLNARLRDLEEMSKRGDIYPDEEWRLQHELVYDYHHMKG